MILNFYPKLGTLNEPIYLTDFFSPKNHIFHREKKKKKNYSCIIYKVLVVLLFFFGFSSDR